MPEHTKFLYEKYPHHEKEKLEIGVGHNEQRPESILDGLFRKISSAIQNSLSVKIN